MNCPKHGTKLVSIWVKDEYGSSRLEQLCVKCHNLNKYKFKCTKCGYINYFYESGTKRQVSNKDCQRCKGTGEVNLSLTIYSKEIPTWRLNMDDAQPEELLKGKPEDFGVKRKSKEDWDDYYQNSPHEQEKMKKFNEDKKKNIRETLSSPDLIETKDSQ